MNSTEVHVVLPGDVHDATVPSGGNVYGLRVCRDLEQHGWRVHLVALAGSWPQPEDVARAALAKTLAALPDDAVVLLDGLVACGVPDVVIPQARRLRLAVLVHLPLADETGLAPAVAADLDTREKATLRAVSAVVVTSPWAAARLAEHGLRVHVVTPGTDRADLARGTDGASRLLCPAAVTPRKGQDLLVRALAQVSDLRWTCACAGAVRRDLGYVERLRRLIDRSGVGDRVQVVGPLSGEQLATAYDEADLVVLTSRAETYGMVVTEALARGIPVLATAVDAVPETLGRAPDGSVPGLLVPPDDTAALARTLRRWLTEPALRDRLRASARSRRDTLSGWAETTRALAGVLETLHRTSS
ncbi:glycosyltransferase family 4 protein [Saccharopolyspora sp. K220]|uniref:glycosyltransferase family 4 protein n=1 Tax=Saccharopolyspora soli TaxID=2926618 RepID=UPI001F575792|nr:glycosyltransferase family 4 protein [Saccharopolyspora soli]MCI2416047.1 glycosyltransferase family 4 protein [Saccharopolyspora soli]